MRLFDMNANVAVFTDGYAILKRDGTVWVMGKNIHGRFGPTTVTEYTELTQSPLVEDVRSIFGIDTGMYYLLKDGTMWYAGFAAKSKFTAIYSTSATETLTQVPLKGVIRVMSNGDFDTVYFLTETGTVYCNGSSPSATNGSGRRTALNASVPVKCIYLHDIINTTTTVRTASATTRYMVFLRADGRLLYESRGMHTESGYTILINSGIRVEDYYVSTINNVKQFSMWNATYTPSNTTYGAPSALVLFRDGTLKGYVKWYNSSNNPNTNYGYGFGNNTQNAYKTISTDVKSYTVGMVDGSKHYIYVIKNNGDLYVEGYNTYGRLGTNNATTVTKLTKVNENCDYVLTTGAGGYSLLRKTSEVAVTL